MSSPLDVSKLLRRNLLEGVSLLVAGALQTATPGELGPGTEIAGTCRALGATVAPWSAGDAVPGEVDMLVFDGASVFAQTLTAGAGGERREALRRCLDAAWEATHAVANAAFIEPERPGRIVYLAPPAARDRPDANELGAHENAARAGLENLARTLSIEWARYGVTTVTIAPGRFTDAGEVAGVVAYLASPAGAYFSGCLLDLTRASGADPATHAGAES